MNVSPIMENHSILVPYIESNLPQMLSPELIELVMQLDCQDGLKLLYNSLGANASVNHLHFHLMHLDTLDGLLDAFPIENTPLKPFL